MNDKNLHINPNPKDGFPEPEIPVDQAWNEMSRLLDAEMPSPPTGDRTPGEPPGNITGGLAGNSYFYWTIAVVVTAIIGFVTWGLLDRTKDNASAKDQVETVEPTPVATIQPSSVTTGQPAAARDTMQEYINVQTVTVDKAMPEESTGTIYADPDPVRFTANDQVSASAVKSVDATPTDPVIIALEENVKDSSLVTTAIPLPAVNSDTSSAYSPAGTVTANLTDIKVPDEKPADRISDTVQPGPAETRRPAREKGNLEWFARTDGNVGMVIEKGRDANLFYGATVSAGLWHQKLTAGIETGVGWENYQDYGSVTNYLQIADSIQGDSLNPVIYSDTTQVTAFKYQYRYVQVPIYISKQLADRGPFALDLRTGPVLGILVYEKKITDYITGPGEGEITGIRDSDYERLKYSWQWHVMVQFRWNLNDRLSLSLNPAGVFYLNNLYEKTDRPSGTPFGISLTGGLIIRF